MNKNENAIRFKWAPLTNASIRFAVCVCSGCDCVDGMTMLLKFAVDEGRIFALLLGRLPSLLNDWLATVPAEDVSEPFSPDGISSIGISTCGMLEKHPFAHSLNSSICRLKLVHSSSFHVCQHVYWYLLRSARGIRCLAKPIAGSYSNGFGRISTVAKLQIAIVFPLLRIIVSCVASNADSAINSFQVIARQ